MKGDWGKTLYYLISVCMNYIFDLAFIVLFGFEAEH